MDDIFDMRVISDWSIYLEWLMSKKKRGKQEEMPPELITAGMKQHLKYLVGLSILAKVAIIIVTVFILGSMMDTYAISYYYEHAITIFQGSYPYISYYYEYPILIFIPVTIALIPSLLLNSITAFIITFSILMIICDCISTICVYLIARKIWNDSKKAFISAFLYITAFWAAYFAIIDFNSFATCLFLIGLTLLLYGRKIFEVFGLTDYSALVLGYFTKIFPIIALPFVVLYKSRSTSLKEEIISVLKVVIPISLVLFVPIFIFNPLDTLKTYIPTRIDVGCTPNTIFWTVYVWLHDIFNIAITLETVWSCIYACIIIGLLILVGIAFKYKYQDPATLLKLILCAIVIVTLATKVRSPGYVLFFTSLICILISDSLYKIGLFYVMQILGFIEFPLGFWRLWTNVEYTNPIYSTNWYLTLILFTLELSSLLILMWVIVEPVKMYKEIFKEAV